ncbi:hypothetical protein [Bradyrhizobium sp. MOS003]|uniref:hypothetical protein n=1 Tax=Bradyrhizobium sp. MOS003 TaxID=2133946 RepID=UPI000D122300|nr:hypothetical protein [Bradyrhizobium sp. MOS003]PSO22096.1 hypothetical protein C7G42_07235 [Bradyrhizobium sp. MOS003]
MPVLQYLLYVGGALLTLLFIVDACVPDRSAGHARSGLSPAIRIYSDQKVPERVVLDTSQITIFPKEIAKGEFGTPLSAESTQTQALDAFAQFESPDAGRILSRQLVKSDAKRQRQSKIARRYIERRIRLVARPPQYGWFGSQMW